MERFHHHIFHHNPENVLIERLYPTAKNVGTGLWDLGIYRIVVNVRTRLRDFGIFKITIILSIF